MSYCSKNTQPVRIAAVALAMLFAGSCNKTPFDLSEAPLRGNDRGDVLVQFTDFDCQSCKAVQASLNALRISHPEIAIAFKSYPLVEGEAGLRKHIIARCVFAQDKASFWLYYDLAFSDNAAAASDPKQTADVLGLDAQALAACAASQDAREAVLRDQREGQTHGVVGTPTFFFKGSRREGSLSAKDMRQFVAESQ